MALLTVNNLSIAISTKSSLLPVVENVSFELNENETLGIVGESGCGKSLTALAIMGLLQGSQVRITNGSIIFDGQNLLVAKLAVGVARYAVGAPSPLPLRVLAAVERIGRGQQAADQVGLRPGDTGADLFAPRLQGDASQRLQSHLAHVEVDCRV